MKNLIKFIFIILSISSISSIPILNSKRSLCLCNYNNKFYLMNINKTKKIKNFTRSYEVIL